MDSKPLDQRIVIAHNRGRMKGIHQIGGLVSAAETICGGIPDSIPNFNFGDHIGILDLIQSHPRYLLYREAITPASTRPFHPSQR